jgi:ADP-ribose pyrophosphatase
MTHTEATPVSMEHATIANREYLVNGPKRMVREDVVMPDGTVIDWYYIDNPPSVMIVPITAEGDVVMVRQWRHNIRTHGLELPAGAIEPGEDVMAAARRELLEETGYALRVDGRMEMLANIYARPSETTGLTCMVAAAPVVKIGEPAGDSLIERYFDMSVVTMDLDLAVASIGREITSAETITALTLATR